MIRRRVTLRTEDGQVLHEGPEPWDVAPRGGTAGDRCFLDETCLRTRFHDGICAGADVVGEGPQLDPADVIWGRDVLGLDEPDYTGDPLRDLLNAFVPFDQDHQAQAKFERERRYWATKQLPAPRIPVDLGVDTKGRP